MMRVKEGIATPGAVASHEPPSRGTSNVSKWLPLLVLATAAMLPLPKGAEAGERGRRVHAPTSQQAEARSAARPQPAAQRRQVRLSETSNNVAAVTPHPTVLHALRRAGGATGTDPALLYAIARRESGFDPKARSRSSSARGLMQFTDATWLEAVRDFGHRHGLARESAILSAVPRGKLPTDARLVAAVLRLREEPHLAAAMTAERLESFRATLALELGRQITPADLYFVHLLGSTGARRFLGEMARAPSQSASRIVGPAAEVNRGIFMRDNRPLTLAEVHQDVSRSLVVDVNMFSSSWKLQLAQAD